MIDSHCHLDFPDYDEDRAEVVERARAAGVSQVLIPGTGSTTWERTRRCAEEHGLAWAIGVHPWFLEEVGELPLEGAAAVGEIGLDRTRPELHRQRRVLRAQLAQARDWGLPVVLHCVKAHAWLLEELRPFAPLRGLLHSWSGSAEQVPPFLELGLCFGFGGVLTWPEAKKARRAALAVPAGRLFVESDGPDQPVASRRPGRSEPLDVVEVVEALERLRGEPFVQPELFGG